MSPRSICATMNCLIRACVDDGAAQAEAAVLVRSAADRATLLSHCADRDRFVRELSHVVERNGGTARRGGSLLRRLQISARHARALLVGFNDGDVYLGCAHVESQTALLYAAALELRLPNDARSVVENQHETIARDEAYLRRKSFFR